MNSKETVITVKNLYKDFNMGPKIRDAVLRDEIINLASWPYRVLTGKQNKNENKYQALKGLSFTVNRGEVVGIVGKNGAGKSTLLKILSRISDPSKGEIVYKGRLGSLIEVGTGFHQELTGRENIYLNGAILGMKRKEVENKFQEIVDFAGIGKYLDIPVKRYSSGMYVRLAFAVAAHLDTDILLVDEVLSVGDAEFQQKSLGKVKDIAHGGRTILFVSHNMSVISQLCTRCLVLSKGKIIFDGNTNEAISRYLSCEYEYFGQRSYKKEVGKKMQIRKISLIQKGKRATGIVDVSNKVSINIEYDVNEEVTDAVTYISIASMEGTILIKTADYDKKLKYKKPGKYLTILEIPPFLFNIGRYILFAGCEIPDKNRDDRENLDEKEAFQFECVDSTGQIEDYGVGILAPNQKWKSERI
jgi:lipopolysaccharide transport system ATP-binding protein